jgi:hypothetical protein
MGFQPMFDDSSAGCRCHESLRGAQLIFQLFAAFVERLQTQLPAMEMDAELIDVSGDLDAERDNKNFASEHRLVPGVCLPSDLAGCYN